MSDWYNFSDVTASSNLLEFAQATNDLVGGWWGLLLLISFFMIMFIAMKHYPTSSSFPIAAALTMLLSFMMRTLSLIPNIAVFICIIATIVSMLPLLWARSSGS